MLQYSPELIICLSQIKKKKSKWFNTVSLYVCHKKNSSPVIIDPLSVRAPLLKLRPQRGAVTAFNGRYRFNVSIKLPYIGRIHVYTCQYYMKNK